MKLNSCLYIDKGGAAAAGDAGGACATFGGLICLSGGPDGPVGRLLQRGQGPAAQALMDALAAMFGDRLYVELQRHPAKTGTPEAER